jgi:hypothetical protein
MQTILSSGLEDDARAKTALSTCYNDFKKFADPFLLNLMKNMDTKGKREIARLTHKTVEQFLALEKQAASLLADSSRASSKTRFQKLDEEAKSLLADLDLELSITRSGSLTASTESSDGSSDQPCVSQFQLYQKTLPSLAADTESDSLPANSATRLDYALRSRRPKPSRLIPNLEHAPETGSASQTRQRNSGFVVKEKETKEPISLDELDQLLSKEIAVDWPESTEQNNT